MEVELTDAALVNSYRQTRDINSFKSLVRRYQNRIFNSAYHLLGNREEAEEVVQDTFVKVHQGIDKFRDESTFSSWVFRISHNLCVDILRDRKKKKDIETVPFPSRRVSEDSPDIEAYDGSNDIPDERLEPARKLDVQEESQVLAESLKNLPEMQRSVVVLHDLEGLAYQEIANIIGASIGTVRSRLHYGRLKLKEMMDAYYTNSSQTKPITRRGLL